MELKDILPFLDPEFLKRWTEYQQTRDWNLVDWTKPKTFTDLANVVRNSGLGGDVREALAKMFEEVSVMVGAGANEEQARQILELIGNSIKKGQVTMSDLTQEVKEVLNGDRPLPIVGRDSVIGYENIVKGTVTPDKTTFVDLFKTNLFIKGTERINQIISEQGQWSSLDNFVSLVIDVRSEQQLYADYVYYHAGVVFLNSSGGVVSSISPSNSGPYTFTVPSGVSRIVIRVPSSKFNAETYMVNVGSVRGVYSDGGAGELKNLYLKQANVMGTLPIEQVAGVKYANIIKLDELIPDTILKDDGTTLTVTTTKTTQPIKVVEGDVWRYNYQLSNFGGYLNADKQWVAPISASRVGDENIYEWTVPKGVSYMVVNVFNDFSESTVLTNDPNADLTRRAVPYGFKLEGLNVGETGRFRGETWLVTGDSITEKNSRATANWHDYLKSWFCLENVINDGKSGTGLVKTYSTYKNIIDRIDDWQATGIDRIVIMGAMNDLQSGETADTELGLQVGTMADTADTVTVYGAMKKLFNKLYAKYPNVPIHFISSSPRASNHGNSSKFAEYMKAYKEVCAEYNVPFTDIYSQSQLRPWLAENNKKYFSSNTSPEGDGTHPNALGQEKLAYQIKPSIEQHG